MKKIILIVALFLSGCVATNNPEPDISTEPGYHNKVKGIFCGLTMTSANGDNACPGCDIDALTLYEDAKSCGVDGVLLNNSQCTWENIKARSFDLCSNLGDGDMFVFTLSGHGASMKDNNWDEEDGRDEVLCLFAADKMETIDLVRDDIVFKELINPLWEKHPGLDIFLITDTCHSEGSFKSLYRKVMPAARLGGELFSENELPKKVNGGLIQIAMCRALQYSYGSWLGGTGTQALLSIRKDNIGRYSAYRAMLPLIDTEQEPQFVEYGQVSPMFRNGEFWR